MGFQQPPKPHPMLTIEKNVPLPANPINPGSEKKYPLRELEVGDSFTAPFAQRAALASAMHKAGKRYGRRFISRREGDAVRVWRVADDLA